MESFNWIETFVSSVWSVNLVVALFSFIFETRLFCLFLFGLSFSMWHYQDISPQCRILHIECPSTKCTQNVVFLPIPWCWNKSNRKSASEFGYTKRTTFFFSNRQREKRGKISSAQRASSQTTKVASFSSFEKKTLHCVLCALYTKHNWHQKQHQE